MIKGDGIVNVIDDKKDGNQNKRKKAQLERKKERIELNDKMYLGEIIELDKPQFETNNLIIAPVGAGKSHLIEKMLIPKNFKGKALYLTSNTALKDSVCPEDDDLRDILREKNKSLGFFSTSNKKKIGIADYSVHVMTYSEFGIRLESPNQTFTKDLEIIFCDEVHSLPTYRSYNKDPDLDRAMRWLFTRHADKKLFYFTATQENLIKLEKKIPGYLSAVTTFDYSNHPKIRRYVAQTTYLIKHIEQLRPHLQAKLESFNYYGYKGLAFTKYIVEQDKICEIAESEGFKPICLWSVNNEEREMNEEQLRVRKIILSTGYIPEPYNLLIINGAMQEGWNLEDDMMRLAILNTLDLTEQIQSLGRIRKDIDLVIKKTNDETLVTNGIDIPEKYMNVPLTSSERESLCIELNLINKYGEVSKWPTVKKAAKNGGYEITDETINIDNKRTRVSIIKVPDNLT